ncbi:TIGR00730 family Rossman fold protein [Bacteroidota bacterium]
MVQKVCIYAAASSQVDQQYNNAAFSLGKYLADNSATIVYGGGSTGLMGSLADGALSVGGTVIGVIPQFMFDLEWGHKGVSDLIVVDEMHERKSRMINDSDAVIALPGGCGTLEELFEAITLKRLGIYLNPIILINTNGYFNSCIEMLDKCINEKFMDLRHRKMWDVVNDPSEVLNAINNADSWTKDARNFAAI